jgi:hypothetical protein
MTAGDPSLPDLRETAAPAGRGMLRRLADSAPDTAIALALVLFVFLQGLVMAIHTPVGYAPDELAHLAYVDDVIRATGTGILPDYAEGTILAGRDRNYLIHPPLYYTTLGLVGRAFSLDARPDALVFRALSAGFVAGGLFFLILAARRWHIEWPVILILTVALAAVPMFGYLAGSVNNDTLLYLGVGMALYGVVASGISEGSVRGGGLALLFLGTLIAVLTKATGIVFLLFFFLAYMALERGRLLSVLRERTVQAWIFVLFVIAGGYYVYALGVFGALFPAPRGLYELRPAEDPIGLLDYLREFVGTLWRRLPVIMSHLSLGPISERMVPVFYLMAMLPVAGWLVVRFIPRLRRAERGPLVIGDAVVIAVVLSIAVHALMGYRGYLSTGVIAGLQPRYYVYLLPLIWMLFFAVSRPGFLRLGVTGVFGATALVVFWASVPFVQAKQYEALLDRSPPIVLSDSDTGEMRKVVTLHLREQVTGNLDVLKVDGGTLFASGWVFDRENRVRAKQVWVFDRGRYLGATLVRGLREDVERAYDDALGRNSGFSIRVAGLPSDTRVCDISVTAEFYDGTFGELSWGDCPANQRRVPAQD